MASAEPVMEPVEKPKILGKNSSSNLNQFTPKQMEALANLLGDMTVDKSKRTPENLSRLESVLNSNQVNDFLRLSKTVAEERGINQQLLMNFLTQMGVSKNIISDVFNPFGGNPMANAAMRAELTTDLILKVNYDRLSDSNKLLEDKLAELRKGLEAMASVYYGTAAASSEKEKIVKDKLVRKDAETLNAMINNVIQSGVASSNMQMQQSLIELSQLCASTVKNPAHNRTAKIEKFKEKKFINAMI